MDTKRCDEISHRLKKLQDELRDLSQELIIDHHGLAYGGAAMALNGVAQARREINEALLGAGQ